MLIASTPSIVPAEPQLRKPTRLQQRRRQQRKSRLKKRMSMKKAFRIATLWLLLGIGGPLLNGQAESSIDGHIRRLDEAIQSLTTLIDCFHANTGCETVDLRDHASKMRGVTGSVWHIASDLRQ